MARRMVPAAVARSSGCTAASISSRVCGAIRAGGRKALPARASPRSRLRWHPIPSSPSARLRVRSAAAPRSRPTRRGSPPTRRWRGAGRRSLPKPPRDGRGSRRGRAPCRGSCPAPVQVVPGALPGRAGCDIDRYSGEKQQEFRFEDIRRRSRCLSTEICAGIKNEAAVQFPGARQHAGAGRRHRLPRQSLRSGCQLADPGAGRIDAGASSSPPARRGDCSALTGLLTDCHRTHSRRTRT